MTDYISQNRDAYNTISSIFSSTRQWLWEDLKPLAAYVHPGDTVLDLGCGNGRVYQLFRDFQVSYIGVDFSVGQIAEAKKMFPDGDFRVGEMTAIPLSDHAVDDIFCIATFHHLPDEESRKKSLGEMKRVLKEQGTLILTNWNLESEWAEGKVAEGKWQKVGPQDYSIPWRDGSGAILANRYYHGFSAEEMENLLTESGFTIVEQYISADAWTDDKKGGNLVTVAKLS